MSGIHRCSEPPFFNSALLEPNPVHTFSNLSTFIAHTYVHTYLHTYNTLYLNRGISGRWTDYHTIDYDRGPIRQRPHLCL